MGNIKQINIKNWTYYFLDDILNIKIFDSNLWKIDKKSFKNIDICYIGYIAMKDYWNIHRVSILHLIINKAYIYIEEIKGNKYETLAFYDKDKETLKKYTEF